MNDSVRAIAFYLPQFHPIAENDAWWGKGYTEWTKVVEGKPLYHGHYQPHLPGELGFYDLRLPEARAAQARLAREHGIHGFCYYHYWFNGKRLLERPFAEVLASGQPDFPFCLCWANEHWTRRWDGRDKEILIAQHYSPEGDRVMIRELMPAFRDPRYIRVNGKPLFLVYRAGLLPDPRATAALWRQEALAAGLPGLYLCRVESLEDSFAPESPAQIGFDAACEFPPQGAFQVPRSNLPKPGLDPDFRGFIYDYAEVAQSFAMRPTPGYRRFHGVMPSWDNTARVTRQAGIAADATPEAYRSWLEIVVNRTRLELEGDERLVFINAWNEWGEGCHLEPDRRHGLAWLEATRAALNGASPKMPFDTPEAHLPLYAAIERLATELGLEGLGAEAVLRQVAAIARRHAAELAKRDDVVSVLAEKLARAARTIGELQARLEDAPAQAR